MRIAIRDIIIVGLSLFGLAIAVVPLQLGARQIVYPRLALSGCYLWLGGLVMSFIALGRNGGFGGGDATAVDLFLASHGLMVVGLAASAGCIAASVLTARAPGMTMRLVPLFAWSALIGALATLVALPVVLGAVILLFLIWHLSDLTWGPANPGFVRGDVYRNLVASFERPWSSAIYIVANVALGVHLFHGAWSMFQSLGLNNPKWNSWRRGFAGARALAPTEEQWGTLLVELYAQTLARAEANGLARAELVCT